MSLIKKHATIGGLDLMAAPELPDESDHHSSSLDADEPEALCSTPELSNGRSADIVQARDLVVSPMMHRNAGDCHLAARPARRSKGNPPHLGRAPRDEPRVIDGLAERTYGPDS